jgi:GTP-binding protein
MSRIVAIIGRPNVGKSTLFNRLVRERKSIVEDIPGITRDRIYGQGSWEDQSFTVIDTGGFDPAPDDPLLKIMKRQVEIALDEADAVILLMDVKSGLNPIDVEIARMVGRRPTPVFHVVNKVDSPEKEREAFEFYQVGIEKLYFISATHGRGVAELVGDVLAALPAEAETAAGPLAEFPHVAVVGRPNVGKSTLINKLVRQERLLTSDIPGTTRDSVDVSWRTPDGRTYVLVDTAGMRRKRSVSDSVEYYSVVRAVKSMERAHVVLLLLDARVGMEEQDARIANLVQDRGRACVIVFNKWDLVEKDTMTSARMTKALYAMYPTLSYVPATFTSAVSGKGLSKLLPLIDEVKQSWEKRISTGDLNRFLEAVVGKTPPPLLRGKFGKVFYGTQATTTPPTIILTVNTPEAFSPNYRRFLLNQLRKEYGFSGSPIRLFLRARKKGAPTPTEG